MCECVCAHVRTDGKFIFMLTCACVCMCVCARTRERERTRGVSRPRVTRQARARVFAFIKARAKTAEPPPLRVHIQAYTHTRPYITKSMCVCTRARDVHTHTHALRGNGGGLERVAHSKYKRFSTNSAQCSEEFISPLRQTTAAAAAAGKFSMMRGPARRPFGPCLPPRPSSVVRHGGVGGGGGGGVRPGARKCQRFQPQTKKKRYGPRPDGTSFLWRFVELEAMLLRAKHDAQIYILIYAHTCTRMSRLNTWTRTRIIYNT